MLRFKHFIYFLLSLNSLIECYYEERLVTPTAKELETLNDLKAKIDQMEESNFYNYHMMCATNNKETRVNYQEPLIHNSIPAKYHNFILETLEDSYRRKNRCPKWTNNIHTLPESGNMDYLALDDQTPVGQVVYLISAVDPERMPIYYFLRKLEEDYGDCKRDDRETIIFDLNQIKMGNAWYAEVKLNQKLDANRKRIYCYVVNAFDGRNIIEKFSRIQVFRSHHVDNKEMDYAHLYHGHDEIEEEESMTNKTELEQSETITKPNYTNDDLNNDANFSHLSNHSETTTPNDKASTSVIIDHLIFYFRIAASLISVAVSWVVSYLIVFF